MFRVLSLSEEFKGLFGLGIDFIRRGPSNCTVFSLNACPANGLSQCYEEHIHDDQISQALAFGYNRTDGISLGNFFSLTQLGCQEHELDR